MEGQPGSALGPLPDSHGRSRHRPDERLVGPSAQRVRVQARDRCPPRSRHGATLCGAPPRVRARRCRPLLLSAQVTPRDVDQGGAVGVHLEPSPEWAGNVPASIAPPARTGVEWLAPEVHEQMGNIGHDTFGGKRSFDYVVRVRRAGEVDLGEVSLRPSGIPSRSATRSSGRRWARSTSRPPQPLPSPRTTAQTRSCFRGCPCCGTPWRGLPRRVRTPTTGRSSGSGASPRGPRRSGSPWPGRASGSPLRARMAAPQSLPVTELEGSRDRGERRMPWRGRTRVRCGHQLAPLEAAAIALAGVNVRGAVGDEVVPSPGERRGRR